MDRGVGRSALAGFVFILASLSDFLDGYLARRWEISSDLGRILDPLADKLIVAAALIMLAAMERSPSVPAWMVFVIIGREIAVTGLRAVALGRGIVMAAEELGKYKMIFQIYAITGLLIHYEHFFINFHVAGMYFLWIALILGLWSGADYYVRTIRALLINEGRIEQT